MTLDKLPFKGSDNDFTSPCDQEEILDRLDCLQRDLAGFKAYIIEHFDEAIDRALKERSKRRPYVEPGYR